MYVPKRGATKCCLEIQVDTVVAAVAIGLLPLGYIKIAPRHFLALKKTLF